MAQKFGSFQGTNNVMYLNHSGSVSTGDIWFDHGNSAIKIYNGTSWDEVGSGSGGGGVSYIVSTSNVTATANQGIIADTSGGSFTVTLPASPSTGDKVFIADGADFATNNLTVARNGSTIEGASEDFILDVGGPNVGFIYDGTTWQVYPQSGLMSIRGIEDNSTSTAITINSSQDVSFSGNVTLGYVDGDFYVTDSSTTNGYVQIGEKYVYGLDDVGGGSFNIQSNGASYLNGGNLGIGTTSPAYRLDAQTSTSTWAGRILNTNASGDGLLVRSDTTDNSIVLGVYGNGAYRMAVLGDGNVGIGTTSPASELNVYHATDPEIRLTIATHGDAGVLLGDADGLKIYGKGNSNQMRFHTGSTEQMRINSSGYVGVNSTAPSYRFEVAGTNEGILGHLKATDSTQAYMMFSNSTTGSGKFADGIIVGLDSDESAVFWNFEATPMRFGTSGTERMRIDSSGNVLVGITAGMTQGGGGPLQVYSGSGSQLILGKSTGAPSISFGSTTTQYGLIEGINGGGFTFYTGNGTVSNRLVIDSSGNVGIGVGSPYGSNLLNVNGGVAIDGRNATTPGLCEKGDTNTGIFWPTTDTLGVSTGGAERMRIDSAGKVGVGITNPSGSFHVTTKDASGSDVYYVAQNTTSNRIAGYRVLDENGANSLQMQYDNGGDAASISNPNNGALSIYLGGTAAGNALDDYEEGNWTPTASSGFTSLTVDTSNCRYTKIGNTVHVRGEISGIGGQNAATFVIGGLPFSVATGVESSFPIMYTQLNIDTNYSQLVGYAQAGSNKIRIYECGDSQTWSAVIGTQTSSSTSFIFALTYETS